MAKNLLAKPPQCLWLMGSKFPTTIDVILPKPSVSFKKQAETCYCTRKTRSTHLENKNKKSTTATSNNCIGSISQKLLNFG